MPLAPPSRNPYKGGGGSSGSGPVRGDDKTRLDPIATWARRARKGNARATRQLQKWLRSQGYGVKVDGKWGPQTASAYRYSKTGNSADRWEPPKAQRQGNPRNRFNKTSLAGPNPRRKRGSGGGGKDGGGGGKGGRSGGGGFGATAGAVSGQLGKNTWKAGTKMDPARMGEILAGLQFDEPIRDLKTLIARAGPQNQQAMQNIGDWYGDVEELSQRAGQRNSAAAMEAASAQDAAIAQLMGALGGAGNDANAQIAASNLQNTGLMRTLGGIEQQYHQDMSPIFAAASASAKQREQRLNLEQLQDYQFELADLMGQRGQAEKAARMEAEQYNSQISQQWFQNKLAQLNASLGAQAAGLDMAATREQIKTSRTARRQAGGQAAGKFVPWNKLSPPDKAGLLSEAVYKPDGTRRSFASAQNYLVSLGYAAGSGGRSTRTSNPNLYAQLRTFYS